MGTHWTLVTGHWTLHTQLFPAAHDSHYPFDIQSLRLLWSGNRHSIASIRSSFAAKPADGLGGSVRTNRRTVPMSPRRLSIAAPARRAFTLIELLLVLAVIGILAGLLLGGVFNVFGTARITQVSAEISSLDQAIAEFKLRFGMEPPSFVILYENGPAWPTDRTMYPNEVRSRALIQRLWPDYDFTTPHNINGDGDTTDVITLQSTEALVFFLGGNSVLDSANPQPLGFSTNPTNPFAGGGQRVGPFFAFNTDRFVDVDGDGCPEYLDPIPGQTLPYLYFSGYDGAGYRPFGMNGTAGDADDEMLSSDGTPLMQSVYMVNDQDWLMDTNRPRANAGEYINPKSYQIISPGMDFRFGVGGTYLRGKGLAIKAGGSMDNFRSREARRPEFDNITNFSGGMLGEETIVK